MRLLQNKQPYKFSSVDMNLKYNGYLTYNGHTVSVCNQSPRPTQPPILCGTGNEYRLKCGDALRWGVKAVWLIVDKRAGGR